MISKTLESELVTLTLTVPGAVSGPVKSRSGESVHELIARDRTGIHSIHREFMTGSSFKQVGFRLLPYA
ncbi:MAG TPA: hypothetical protein VJ788_00210 [Gemmatimonadota bacterium]|nr:hypothetical protein [Gemmatimonadota bacterium]